MVAVNRSDQAPGRFRQLRLAEFREVHLVDRARSATGAVHRLLETGPHLLVINRDFPDVRPS